MIDIILFVEKINIEYTLASLVNKPGNYRVHLFFVPAVYDEYEADGRIKWILNEFREVYIYQTPWVFKKTRDRMARILLQFKEHWKDKQPKGLPIERCIVSVAGSRLFLGDLDKDVPKLNQMNGNIVYFTRQFKYENHPQYKNYYNIIGLQNPPIPEDKRFETDKRDREFLFVDWTKFKDLNNNVVFFPNRKATIRDASLSNHDNYINSAKTDTLYNYFINKTNEAKSGFMPLYFNMSVDKLIVMEAIGAKDCINNQIAMRKAFSVTIDGQALWEDWEGMSTLFGLAVPWDLWAQQLDNIPLNMRWQIFNEKILVKAEKQKRHVRKVVEAGYLLGKI